jgi:hypothetical protein
VLVDEKRRTETISGGLLRKGGGGRDSEPFSFIYYHMHRLRSSRFSSSKRLASRFVVIDFRCGRFPAYENNDRATGAVASRVTGKSIVLAAAIFAS